MFRNVNSLATFWFCLIRLLYQIYWKCDGCICKGVKISKSIYMVSLFVIMRKTFLVKVMRIRWKLALSKKKFLLLFYFKFLVQKSTSDYSHWNYFYKVCSKKLTRRAIFRVSSIIEHNCELMNEWASSYISSCSTYLT